jgi:hypothetical protein
LFERLKALYINPDCIFVAFLCSIESVLLGVAKAPQETHRSLEAHIRSFILSTFVTPIVFVCSGYPFAVM